MMDMAVSGDSERTTLTFGRCAVRIRLCRFNTRSKVPREAKHSVVDNIV